MSDFSESIIIPLSMFKKCNFESKESKLTPNAVKDSDEATVRARKFLFDENLENDDAKIKLYNQHKRLYFDKKQKPVIVKQAKVTETPHQRFSKENDISSILQSFALKTRPFVNSILRKFLHNEDVITWDSNMEVIIDGVQYPESNIIELLKYIMGSKVVTSEEDIPIATDVFLDAIENLNIPKSWVKIPKKNPPRSSTTSSTRRPNSSSSWISLS